MKTWIAITIAVMMMFLVVGLAESEGKAFGQLGGSSRYSPSRGYTGGHQFNRNLIGNSKTSSGRYSRGSRSRFTGYSRSRNRSYQSSRRSYYSRYSRNRRTYASTRK